MANYIITINAGLEAEYQSRTNSLHKGQNCSGFVFENTLSIAGESPIPDNNILLSPWNLPASSIVLSKMYIRNYISSDNNRLWYEYNSVKLEDDLVIDISGLSYSDVIPLFFLKGNQDPSNNTTQEINCEIALEDNAGNIYSYRQNKMIVYYSLC